VSDHFSARQGVEDDHMNTHLYGRPHYRTLRAWDILEASWPPKVQSSPRHLRRLAKWLPGAGSNQRAWGWNTAQVLIPSRPRLVAIVKVQPRTATTRT